MLEWLNVSGVRHLLLAVSLIVGTGLAYLGILVRQQRVLLRQLALLKEADL